MHMAETAQTLVLLRLCTLPVLPYRVERLAEWTLGALNEIEELGKGAIDFGGLLEGAAVFKEKASGLDEATARLAERIEGGAKGLEDKIRVANSSMMKVSRVMNPVNYTLRGRYDQDYYGAEYVQPIPILRPVSELAALNPDSTEHKTLSTKLVRAGNAVSDALREAVFIIEYAVERIRR
jgi:hypothetical protein